MLPYRERLYLMPAAFGLLMLSTAAQAKTHNAKVAPKEPPREIAVVGHIPLTNGPVSRFLATRHLDSYYLYAEHDTGKSVTLVDVTKVAEPVVLADVTYPFRGGTVSIFTVSGTTALVGGEEATAAKPVLDPQTIRIMDLSDPRHPKVAREFAGVTAIGADDRRGLIFLANPEGVWILQQSVAQDPEVEKAYAHHVLYDH
ncbi:MAG: hypothetical protein ABSG56_07115 [Bryobacteraceae bacterium]|jgi:hypothetical protein